MAKQRVEYWTVTGEWTASGCTRFIKATIVPQHGQQNIRVIFDEHSYIVSIELIEPIL